jgi:hypothetical protein
MAANRGDNNSDVSDRGFNDHDTDFENKLDPEEEEFDLTKDLLLFRDDTINNKSNNGSFVDINEYL